MNLRRLPAFTLAAILPLAASLSAGEPEGSAEDATVKITQENYEAEVEDSTEPIVLYFWAIWCPPCRAVSPVIKEIAKEYGGSVKFAVADADKVKAWRKFGARGFPFVVFLKDGKEVHRLFPSFNGDDNGAAKKNAFRCLIDVKLLEMKSADSDACEAISGP